MRRVDSINRRKQSLLGVKHFRIVQLLVTLGLVLSIVGGSNGDPSQGGGVQVSTTSKVGILLYIVAYAALCVVCFFSTNNIAKAESGEKRLALVVMLALPFILVRLTYSALAVFVHNHHFNIIDGSVTILIIMAVLEEFIVVVLYLVCGFTMEKTSPELQGPIASRPWKVQR